jgi:hypothetical protein
MIEDIKILLRYLADFTVKFEEEGLDLYDLDKDQAMRSELIDIQRKYNLHKFEKE